jgi:ABC-type multidrug transport system permease subunit
VSTLRAIVVLALLHAKQASRSSFEIANYLILPIVLATLAIYIFRASSHPDKLLGASVGAGLIGVWSNVLQGSGSAMKMQRIQGTLEMLILSPRSSIITILPLTVSYGLTGTYSVVGTLAWGKLLFGVPLDFVSPVMFIAAIATCIAGLGMFGLLLAVTFVLVRDAHALCNALESPVSLISGLLVPITTLPVWLSSAAKLLPTTWAASGAHAAVTGGPVWQPLLVCIGISVACLLIAASVMPFIEYRSRVTASLPLSLGARRCVCLPLAA